MAYPSFHPTFHPTFLRTSHAQGASLTGALSGSLTILRGILAHPALLLSRHTVPLLTRFGRFGVSLTGQDGLRTDCHEEYKKNGEKIYATLCHHAHF